MLREKNKPAVEARVHPCKCACFLVSPVRHDDTASSVAFRHGRAQGAGDARLRLLQFRGALRHVLLEEQDGRSGLDHRSRYVLSSVFF